MKRLLAIRDILLREDYDALVETAVQHGGRIAGALIGLLVDLDEQIKWRAVTALGRVGRRLYLQDPERLRKVIRQLIWNLNEESGGIGWGMAEAFGEILAAVPEVREEYLPLLVSYLAEEACRPGNPELIKGVVWALGRVKTREPGLGDKVYPFLLALLKDPDPALKGLSAWALGEIRARKARSTLERLQTENQMIKIYIDGSLQEKPFPQWVNEAIEKLDEEVNNMTENDWKCSKCGYTLKAQVPPETCPNCKEKCEFLNVTCYIPECGFTGSDQRLK